MSDQRLTDYLAYMHRAASSISHYTEQFSKDDFVKDERTQQAVIMNLIIIGEAATKVMDAFPDFARSNPEIEWHKMRGMRNRIAHGYFDINLEVVWDTVRFAIPELIKTLNAIRAKGGLL